MHRVLLVSGVVAVKSIPAAPWVRTWMEPMVVLAATSNQSVAVWLHGEGVVEPDGQTLALPRLTGPSCSVQVSPRNPLESLPPKSTV